MNAPTLTLYPGALSPHTQYAVEKFKTGKPGDAITREDMAKVIKRPCDNGDTGYANVNSAIRICERQHGVVWRWDRNAKAWRCLADGERITEAGQEIGRVKKRATRALRVAATVDQTKLTPEERIEHSLTCTTAGMLATIAGGSFHKRLKELNGSISEPNTERLIQFMRKGT